MRSKIKFAFTDGGHLCQKLMFKILQDSFECSIDMQNPDILVYSLYGDQHWKYSCKKVQVIAENSFPDFNECDYAISPHYLTLDNRHCRIPFYVFNKEYQLLTEGKILRSQDPLSRQFCSAVISNNLNADRKREDFLKALNSKKSVCSIGKCLNNCGFTLDDRPPVAENLDGVYTNPAKVAFSNQFKFSLAMENSSVKGYCTEKITDAFIAGTVPIYWGDPSIESEFNKDSFINISNFKTIDEAVEYVLSIDRDNDKYMSMLNCRNIVLHDDYLNNLKDFLMNVIEGQTFEHSHGNIINRLNMMRR